MFLLWFGYYLRSIFIPVLIGIVGAYLFTPFITYMHREWKVPRLVTTLILVIALLLLVGTGMLVLGPLIVDQTMTLTRKLPAYVQWVADQYGLQHEILMNQVQPLAAFVREHPFKTFQSIFTGTSRAFDFMGSLIGTVTYVMVSFALIPIYIYFVFFAWHFPAIIDSVRPYIPVRHKTRTFKLVFQMDEAVGSFFRGRLVIVFLMAIMFSVGW